jgi:parallel beta-helix repeat protein
VNGGAAGMSGSGGSYSFVMPGMDAQITAEFVSSAKELLSFAFGSWAGTVNESAKTVTVTVPYGTAISGITPTATVSTGADYSPKETWGSSASGSTKTYTVTAGDGTSANYVATVTIAAVPVYNIVVSPSANGTVTVSATTAMAGETVTLTVNPASGYGLKPGTLQVNGGAIGMSGSGGSYSFVMPGMDVQITAEFASSAKELLSFAFGSWAGTVNESAKTVAVTVPYGTLISAITPTATVSAGADYNPKEAWGSGVSGSTKTYTVTAADGTSADYVATVTIAAPPVYNIVATPSLNGAVTASPTSAPMGETVALTVSPDSGSYGLKAGTLLVKETSSGALVALSESGGSYSFVMPPANVTVTAEFVAVGSSFSVAQRGVTLYESLKDAIAAAPSGSASSPDEIILLKTIELPESGTTGYVIDKHIKLVSSSGTNAIERKNTFTNDSLFTVSSGASLTLDGSPNALVIDGDNVSANAALITVDGGTLNMYDGVTLKNNKNTSAYYGGGVRITSGGSFIMNGGTISGNTANSNGGGVYVSGSGSRFEMQGGTIGGSGTGEKNTAVNGGGVMVSGGASFEMTAGFITGNTASSSGGGVDISGSNSRFEMQGGSITGNTAVNGGGVGIIGINNPSARFEMQGGSITGNIASGNGGGVHISEGAALFEMKGGTIGGSGLEKNTAANGGGVVINNGASFEMTAGSITGNNVGNNRNGGGVYISGSNSRFEMKGGSITGNNAGNNSNGGGVYISGSGSRFEMKGGALGGIGEENTVGSSGSGGGVYVANPGEFAMSGAAYLIGNGVHVFGTITMEGGARVADEWVYLTSGTVITLKGDMTGTVPVAVIYPADTTTGTKVLDGTSPLIPNNKAKFNVDIAGPNPPPPYSGSNITIDGRLP